MLVCGVPLPQLLADILKLALGWSPLYSQFLVFMFVVFCIWNLVLFRRHFDSHVGSIWFGFYVRSGLWSYTDFTVHLCQSRCLYVKHLDKPKIETTAAFLLEILRPPTLIIIVRRKRTSIQWNRRNIGWCWNRCCLALVRSVWWR